MRRRPRLREAAWPAALVLVVSAITIVTRAHLGLTTDTLATSPERTAQGKLWLLVSSGLYVDHPVAISLLCFAALAALTVALCGGRTFWTAALLGHVGSTVLVYLFIALARFVQPQAFDSALGSLDFGVSAISSAWLGAVATVAWRSRSGSCRGRAAIALSCAAVALFAYTLRPDITVLSSEHLVAFAFGVALATPAVRSLRRARPRLRSRRVDPYTLAGVGAAAAAIAIGAVPSAFADLKEQLLPRRASAARCVASWNGSRSAPRRDVASGFRVATAAAHRRLLPAARAHRRRTWADYCSLAFYGAGTRVFVVESEWRHGHAGTWRETRLSRREGSPPPNARVMPGGRLRLARTV